jgi:glycine/D-amino acid oxidase-like deaminating enzyme
MMNRSDKQAALNDRERWDIVVIGAGQAGLALSYYLRRTPWSWIVVDGEIGPGGAWRHGWESLRLFSPAQWSSLPGWPMPAGADDPPTRDEVLDYFAAYEARYALPIQRPVRVQAAQRSTILRRSVLSRWMGMSRSAEHVPCASRASGWSATASGLASPRRPSWAWGERRGRPWPISIRRCVVDSVIRWGSFDGDQTL